MRNLVRRYVTERVSNFSPFSPKNNWECSFESSFEKIRCSNGRPNRKVSPKTMWTKSSKTFQRSAVKLLKFLRAKAWIRAMCPDKVQVSTKTICFTYFFPHAENINKWKSTQCYSTKWICCSLLRIACFSRSVGISLICSRKHSWWTPNLRAICTHAIGNWNSESFGNRSVWNVLPVFLPLGSKIICRNAQFAV